MQLKTLPENSLFLLRQLSLILLLMMLVMLSACEDDTHSGQTLAPLPTPPVPRWLDGQVDMTPQQWLLKRSISEPEDFAAETNRIAELLLAASERYDESHRMIANRSVQLEDMLQEKGFDETAGDLLAWFVAMPSTLSPHSYSALCQYYFNLRTQGLTEDAIMQNLIRM